MNRLVAHDPLVLTTTGEPMQPVRLYFAFPEGERYRLRRRLEVLRCVERHPRVPVWGWWHRREALKLDFSRFAASAQPSPKPVILGTISFPDDGTMEIQVRPYHRAWLAARFFTARLACQLTLVRARILNRLLTASDATGGPDAIDALLDQDVVVVDPAAADARWEETFARRPSGAGPVAPEELERLCGEALDRRRGEDVPEVEDFPLCPEEETPEFASLKLTLDLRFLRAMRHRQGRTDLTFVDIIREMVGDAGLPPASADLLVPG